MKLANIQFPEPLLFALRDSRLVVFAGSGVSMGEPANLPDFKGLADQIAEGTGETRQETETEDRFLGRLQHRKVNVHNRAGQILSRDNLEPTELHRHILRLYSEKEQVRIVTTNFDLLFEQSASNFFVEIPEIFCAPALPLGRNFTGIVHIHGSVKHPNEMVLTDSDFGRAYLTEGWARQFLVDLFQRYTVLFIGYSHNDTIVNYLARAIPESEAGKRFILAGDDEDHQHWDVLGIEPIVYPKSSKNDYTMLYSGIRCLADTVKRSILDWQREITEIAEKLPPINEEEASIIEYALKDAPTTRFFTKAAHLPEWIKWIDERKYLDVLFTMNSLGECEVALASWLAERFVIDHSEFLFLLFSKHRMRIHPHLWIKLARAISLNRESNITNETLSRWISLLLATIPTEEDSHELFFLGECCIRQRSIKNLLIIFDIMMSSRLMFKQNIFWHVEHSSPMIDVEISLIGEHYLLNELWEKGLKPNLLQIVEPLLEMVVRRLEEQHFILCAWQKASQEWNPDNFHRSAIEPHPQDEYPQPIDVLIDVVRDCLEYLVSNQVQTLSYWCDKYSGSEAPLLRRLVIHAVSMRDDLSADEKVNWLLIHINLHDYSAHHEIFRVVSLIYPQACAENRIKIINTILDYQWPEEDNPNREKYSARHHFNWLDWLKRSAPDCELIDGALNSIIEKYPEFQLNEHPDFSHWHEGGRVEHYSPWTAQELLAKPPSEWLPELLSYQPKNLREGYRYDLILTLSEVAKQEFEWGNRLALILANSSNWDTDLWDGAIRAWSEMELNESSYPVVLQWIEKVNLHKNHARVIAEALKSLLKYEGKSFANELLLHTTQIAITLWSNLDRTEPSKEENDYLTSAINHPAGILVEFWIRSISLWWNKQVPVPNGLNDGYRKVLTDIISDRNRPGILGRSILSSQLSFLFSVDEEWTRKYLLPLLEENNDIRDYRAVWDGFLSRGQLNPAITEHMEKAFLNAIKHIEHDLKLYKDRFIHYYTNIIMFYVPNPIDTWIPDLFHYGNIDARTYLATSIAIPLRNMNDNQQQELWQRWLKHYWENRLLSIPAPLDPKEIECMFNWLPNLKSIFPEAVDLAIQIPHVQLQHTFVFSDLDDHCELLNRFPEKVAQLLIYLGESGSPPYIYHHFREISDELIHIGISPKLEENLKEIVAELGFL